MSSIPPGSDKPEWYYVGHYGQLGPLTQGQLSELIESGVIERQTFIWKAGMTDWVPAATIPQFSNHFLTADIFAPPPTPGPSIQQPTQVAPPTQQYNQFQQYGGAPLVAQPHYLPSQYAAPSDKSKIVAGILNIFLPGVGRIYLGYAAIGVLQLLTTFFCGVGAIWAFIDGVLMLTGSVQYDGYGRRLN